MVEKVKRMEILLHGKAQKLEEKRNQIFIDASSRIECWFPITSGADTKNSHSWLNCTVLSAHAEINTSEKDYSFE